MASHQSWFGFLSTKNNANKDIWSTIWVIFNRDDKAIDYQIDKTWSIAVVKDSFDFDVKESVTNMVFCTCCFYDGFVSRINKLFII